jgi:hypothetical protein
MRTIGKLGALFVFVAAMAYAETWSGRLVDASCDMEKQTASCVPTKDTTAFALVTSDAKLYKFDEEGNKKAAEALAKSESGAEREMEPEADASETEGDGGSHDIMATVSGTMREGHIEVESVEVN